MKVKLDINFINEIKEEHELFDIYTLDTPNLKINIKVEKLEPYNYILKIPRRRIKGCGNLQDMLFTVHNFILHRNYIAFTTRLAPRDYKLKYLLQKLVINSTKIESAELILLDKFIIGNFTLLAYLLGIDKTFYIER